MTESRFRSRFDALQPMCGIFIKIPHLAVIESLADTGIDFIVLDQEHAPLDRGITDALLFAAHALALPALVRVPNAEPSTLLSVLDAGAAGVLVPHVIDGKSAARIADACRYRTGRGYSGAARSLRGRGVFAEAIASADGDVVVIAQIEDASAIPAASGVAACPGIDGLFIGRGDLAVSLHTPNSDAPVVWEAAHTIATAAATHRKAAWAFASSWQDAERLADMGVSAIIFGSDQSHLKAGASALSAEFGKRRQNHSNAK